MYADDSFYTLSLVGRLAVLALSGALFLTVCALSVALMRGRRGALRLATGAFLFVLFVWLSPQAYYEVYRLIVGALPAEWVVGAPPPLGDLIDLVTFAGDATLSAHGQGALFWALVWISWRLRRRLKPMARAPDL